MQADAPNANVADTWLLSILHLFEASRSVGVPGDSVHEADGMSARAHSAITGLTGLGVPNAAHTGHRRRIRYDRGYGSILW